MDRLDQKTESEKQIQEEKNRELYAREEKEIQDFLKNYPTEEEQKKSQDFNKIVSDFKESYLKKHEGKKCFHEIDEKKTKTVEGGGAIVTNYYCKFCGVDFLQDVCSPWDDGTLIYKDKEFGELKKEIENFHKENLRIYERIRIQGIKK